jgi:hypothetical protein
MKRRTRVIQLAVPHRVLHLDGTGAIESFEFVVQLSRDDGATWQVACYALDSHGARVTARMLLETDGSSAIAVTKLN